MASPESRFRRDLLKIIICYGHTDIGNQCLAGTRYCDRGCGHIPGLAGGGQVHLKNFRGIVRHHHGCRTGQGAIATGDCITQGKT